MGGKKGIRFTLKAVCGFYGSQVAVFFSVLQDLFVSDGSRRADGRAAAGGELHTLCPER